MILDTYIDFLLKFPLHKPDKSSIRNNLDIWEWESIMKIKKDNTIIVKECDKGGACVIVDAKFYNEKMCNILRD